MDTLNRLDIKRIKKKPEDYAVFVVFRTHDQLLQIAFGQKRHTDVKKKFWEKKEHVGWGVISYEDGGYKFIGREWAPDSQFLSDEILVIVKKKLEEICQTSSIEVVEPFTKKKK